MIKSSYLAYLLSLIKTKTYAEEVMSKIDELKDSLYNKRIDLDKKMGELFSFELKEKIKAYSWQEQVNLNDPESFGQFLTSLRSHIKNMPIVTIKLAYQPDAETADEISGWFVQNYGKNVLIDFVQDASLIAGAKVKFNETEKDFSLSRKILEKYPAEVWKKLINSIRQNTVSNELNQNTDDDGRKSAQVNSESVVRQSTSDIRVPSVGLSA